MKSIALVHSQRDVAHPQRELADPMTPEQFYDQLSRTHHLEGESRLLFAVLEDAIRCYTIAARSSRRSHQRALDEVKEWVNTRGDHDLFSFDSICRVFDLEPEQMRRQLNSLEPIAMGRRRFRTVGRRIAIRASD
jgi:hypothetical protein